jgi:hypothetical protein
VPKFLAPTTPADLRDWRHPDVGWGLVLPHREGLTDADVTTGADAPEPIRELLASRPGSPVFRYIPNPPYNLTHLSHPAAKKDPMIGQPSFGLKPGAIPRYLLIYATPDEIPWSFQYILNGAYFVGRLTLEGEALARYVRALIDEWPDAASRVDQPVAWAADLGEPDITHLMRDLVAARVYDAWRDDEDIGAKARFIDGAGAAGAAGQVGMPAASAATLIRTLAERKPALVVTTSHGQTGPVGDPETMAATIGLPVDQDGQALRPDELLGDWQPEGAIWYAHACCSAGSDANTSYDGLVEENSPVDQVLKGVASLGSRIAPLPIALLGAEKPLRAFIGHVEPTFDWTLRHPETGQPLTDNIESALYENLYLRQPVGLAFHTRYDPLRTLRSQYDQNYDLRLAGTEDDTAVDHSLQYSRLTARDLEGMVILGDPTAVLPALPKVPSGNGAR